MDKENEKEIGKEFQHNFLPKVEEKTMGKILRELENNPSEFITKTFNQMGENKNSELGRFLFWKGRQYEFPSSFYLGVAFVYQSLFKESNKTGTSFPSVSEETIEGLHDEITTTGKIYLKKEEDVVKNEFQELLQLSVNGIFFIAEEDVPKFNEVLVNFNERQKELIKEYERNFKSIIPSPTFYSEENPLLMEVIFQLPNYGMGKCQATGAMYTYELLRRQAETDYLEKEFKK